MAAEHAAVRVQLVDDDVLQVFEEFRPARMVRQDAGVHHVRIAEDEVRARSDGPPRVLRGVAVVGEDSNFDVRVRGPLSPGGHLINLLADCLQLGELILRERLRRKQIQRAARGILEDRMQDGDVVAERLAGRRRRDDDDVPPGERVVDRFSLMRVELRDPA